MFSLICAWTNGWGSNGHAGDLSRQCAHYGVAVMAWKRFRITGPLRGEFSMDALIKASNIEFSIPLCCQPGQAVEQTLQLPVIWNPIKLMWRRWNDKKQTGLNFKDFPAGLLYCVRRTVSKSNLSRRCQSKAAITRKHASYLFCPHRQLE